MVACCVLRKSKWVKTERRPSNLLGPDVRGYNFTVNSEIPYDYYKDVFELELMGNNSLGVNTWTYSFNHHSKGAVWIFFLITGLSAFHLYHIYK